MFEFPDTRAMAVATALCFAGAAPAFADAWLSRPNVPASLAVPATAKLIAHFHAVGAQVYVCAPAPAGGAPGWTLKAPDATLLDEKGKPAGTHGAGPVWRSTDGSSVAAKKAAQADAPSAGAIPWLLLRAEKTAGAGVFSQVAYVQRVATKDGTPPTAKCDAAATGAEKRVEYSAEYYFYAAPPG